MPVRHWPVAPLLAAAFGLCLLGRVTLNVEYGLRAEYFDRAGRDTSPVFVLVDSRVSASEIASSWLTGVPEQFGVRWSGFLAVPRDGRYTFALRSDAEALLWIDGTVLLRRLMDGGTGTTSAQAELSSGLHAVRIDYGHKAGAPDLAWMWGADEASLSEVPSRALTTSRVRAWKLQAGIVLEWLAMLTLAGALLTGWREVVSVPARYPKAASLVFFAVLTVVETWPLAAHPARLSRNDNSDTILNEWAIAWVAHQAPRDPLRLFDANIFHPDRNTLAYSESMLVQAAMAAPILWLGGSPVLAYNLVLLAGFTLTGWALCLVVQRWTADWRAGLVSGILIAFNAHVFTRMPHLQIQHGEFLPLALLALDSLLRNPRAGAALHLALWFVLQALTSVYFLAFTSVSMIVAALVRPDAWWGRERLAKLAPWIALATVVAAVLLVPPLLPYWAVRQDQGELTGALAAPTTSGAKWFYYLSTPSRIDYALFSERWFATVSLFPGAIGLLLCAVTAVSGTAWRDRRARMAAAIGLAGLILSFGAAVPGFTLLRRVFPPIQAARDVPRFGYLVIFAVALLAGFGVALLLRRSHPRWKPALAAALVLAAAVEPAVAPLRLQRFDGIPPIYSRLHGLEGAVVAELPVFTRGASFHEAPYMLNSTLHWRPMVNGYSGFQPRDYRRNAPVYSTFPAASAIAALQSAGVTHIFLHREWYPPTIARELESVPSLRLLESTDSILLYELASAATSRGRPLERQ